MAGRPPYQPTEQDRQLVITLTAGGIEQDEILLCLSRRISKPTLRRHFGAELKSAKPRLKALLIQSLTMMATKGNNVVAAIWLSKNLMGWRDTTAIVNGEPGGAFAVSFRWADATPPEAAPNDPTPPTEPDPGA